MALTFTVNGTSRLSHLRDGSLTVDKHFGVEVLSAELWERVTPGAGAFRPVLGDVVLVYVDAALIFGGEVVEAVERVIWDSGGRPSATIIEIQARGFEVLADRIVVPYFAAPARDVYVTVYALFTYYLAPLGVTFVTPTSGGVVIPAAEFDHMTLAAILFELAQASGHVWRINGEKWCAFQAPGALTGPAITEANVRDGDVRVTASSVARPNRLFLQTGGSGVVDFHETHTADGTQYVIPLNVEAQRKRGAINATGGYAAGATTINIDGLYGSRVLQAADTFTIADHPAAYVLTGSDVTGSSDGAFTGVTFTPALSAAVPDDTPLTFDARTFARLYVNGVETSIRSGAWSYNALEHYVTKSGGAPAAGTAVKFLSPITYPATVRVWAATLQVATGLLSASSDAVLSVPQFSDAVLAKKWGDEEVSRRAAEPQEVTVRTRTAGYYPLQGVSMTLPDQGIAGTFLIQSVTVTVLDPSNVEFELVGLADGTVGRTWVDYFRERGTGGGGGGSVVVTGGGGAGGSAGGGGGTAMFPSGATIYVGGSNDQTRDATTAWAPVPEAIPCQLGGAGMAGTWTLRVPCYQLSAGTMEVRLYNQTAGAVLGTVTTTAVGTYVDPSFYGYLTVAIAAPAAVSDVLLECRVTAGARAVVVGHSTMVKA